jgi:hypothetical protein
VCIYHPMTGTNEDNRHRVEGLISAPRSQIFRVVTCRTYSPPFTLSIPLYRESESKRKPRFFNLQDVAKALIGGHHEVPRIFGDLKSALHEHSERMRQVAALKLVRGENGSPPERRSA